MADTLNRRPIRSRDWQITQSFARWLSRRDITPNQISLASIGFAALAALCLACLPILSWGGTTVLCLLAALGILGRALCNLFDGLVAVEGGKGTRAGELFNEAPDRVADILILVAAGYATQLGDWVPLLGWSAALLAVLTAYIRTLGRSLGGPSDFRGPMAKAHRMGVVGLACVLTPLEALANSEGILFLTALIVVNIGCVITLWRRTCSVYLALESSSHV